MLRLEHGLVAVIVDGRDPVNDDRNESMPVERERTRENTNLCLIFCVTVGVVVTFNVQGRRSHALPAPTPTITSAGTGSHQTPSSAGETATDIPSVYTAPILVTSFDEFRRGRPLYQRHWRVRASLNNARGAKTVSSEKESTLTKYQPTPEFFNDVISLQGICAQEKVSSSHITGDRGTDTTACLAPSNRCPVHIHNIDVDFEEDFVRAATPCFGSACNPVLQKLYRRLAVGFTRQD